MPKPLPEISFPVQNDFSDYLERVARYLTEAKAVFMKCDRRERSNDDRRLRARLETMNDCELLRYGCGAKYALAKAASLHRPYSKFIMRLRLARAEWSNRFIGTVISNSF
jgi:hypothetical protein